MPFMPFKELINLAAERLGARVLQANDEFFGPKENLVLDGKPFFIEGKYTGCGRLLDGWQTRRRRTPGHDWCVVHLGLPGIVRGVLESLVKVDPDAVVAIWRQLKKAYRANREELTGSMAAATEIVMQVFAAEVWSELHSFLQRKPKVAKQAIQHAAKYDRHQGTRQR